MTKKTRVAIVGGGAIGTAVVRHLAQHSPDVQVVCLVTRSVHAVAQAVPSAGVDLVVECAGGAAVAQHVLPALGRGIPCIVASVGALADEELAARLEEAASKGRTFLRLVAGGVGGIDVLSAAALDGLSHVEYEGRKPPRAWGGTPAAEQVDLDALAQPVVIFDGSARDAARLYPRNANVAATVALAGMGLDRTRVMLTADPSLSLNRHVIRARGVFGEFEITLSNEPMASNPRTSALAAMSVARAVMDFHASVRMP
ncbi:aspartate dehydrogenase [Variovorax sp. VNK109]|jgi:aspartate dehydrogenase|uniref:aspartate dehydrogenase n=1 Tax=Variovorax sp. VNK109 TaxID=3400919 RepID=UPI003C0C57C3